MATENKKYNSYEDKNDKKEEDAYNPLDIWRVNPSYKDISVSRSNVKVIFLMSLMLLLTISTYLLTTNRFITLIFAIFLVFLFFSSFYGEFYYLENGFNYLFRDFTEIAPFENFKFYMLKKDPATVLIINKKDMLTIATRIFKVDVLAQNVQPTINQFLYALDQSKTPYTYQVVQKPLVKLDKNPIIDIDTDLKNRAFNINSIDSYQTNIYFSVYHIEKGILNNRRIHKLLDTITLYSNSLKSNFSANFHHTKISLLKRQEDIYNTEKLFDNEEREEVIRDNNEGPISALRTIIGRESFDSLEETNRLTKKTTLSWSFISRLVFTTFIIGYLTVILYDLNFPLIYIFSIDIIVISLIIFLWWRELLFNLSELNLKHYSISEFEPFSGVKFYRLKELKDTLFFNINNKVLVASKIYNLREAIQPSFAMEGKFITSMIQQKSSFIYTLNAAPIDRREFSNEPAKKLNDKTKDELEGIIFHTLDKKTIKKYKYPKAEFINWMEKRTGIWKSSFTLSTSSYRFINESHHESLTQDCYELENELHYSAVNMMKVFQKNFKKLSLVPLQSKTLISGFQGECIKNFNFRLTGTHINYLYFQGKKLIELTNLANEFKKGMDVRIAAEFNTPLHLENHINIGHTFNTEILEKEVPLGFKLEQLSKLLITNGTHKDRELLCMKIVTELIKVKQPSIIFDFFGNWSKILKYFEDSRYAHEFLYFKLGNSFNINLINSEVKDDKNNYQYLNYFYDVYAMAFKEQKGNIDILKETIKKNDLKTISSINLDLEHKQDWEKGYNYDEVLSFFRDFKDQSIIFADKLYEYEGKITPEVFLKDDKTVIIDLSILKDLELKIFVTFVLISKFIHYVNNSIDYIEKRLIIPHADLFFDAYYLDNVNTNDYNYGKVDKFFTPLLQKGFGLLLTSNQIRYLHQNVFNYIENIITFKAIDVRDIAFLKNLMNLQELHGTGYYSSKRNNTYQIEYLKNMNHEEVLVKRSDIPQPFPGILDYSNLNRLEPLNYYKIMEFMKVQGYNLKLVEEILSAKAKKTLFEKDLGVYSEFLDDIKKFLVSLKTVDQVALSRRTLLKSLTDSVRARASRKTKDIKQLKGIVNELFTLLLKHGYLETISRNTAGGAQAMYSSYIVGRQYDKAMKDLHETNNNYHIEKLELEPSGIDLLNLVENQTQNKLIDIEKIKEILLNDVSDAIWDLFQMHKSIKQSNFEMASRIGKDIIQTFLNNFYEKYCKAFPETSSNFNKIDDLIKFLNNNTSFPLNLADLDYYLGPTEIVLQTEGTSDKNYNIEKLYKYNSEFIQKMRKFLESNNS